ncbi:MAG: YbhB/YbcL family Raf kinase inhibitor-like protein [Chloroflexaceae bacterium]
MGLTLNSPAFREGETIPQQFTCDGQDISPELRWSDVPNNTRSFVLIMDDPDAPSGTFTHWILFNLPADIQTLPEEGSSLGTIGKNDFGKVAYGGPCPPPGDQAHRYYFALYALDIPTLNLEEGTNRGKVEAAMQGHIVGKALLMGRYARG